MCRLCERNPNKKKCHQREFRHNIDNGLVKMIIKGYQNKMYEPLWCEPVSHNLLRVRQIPFFNDKCCIDDIVEAEQTSSHEWLFNYKRTVERITEPMYIKIEDKDLGNPEALLECKKIIALCRKSGLKIDSPLPGYIGIAIPYGKKKHFQKLIRKIK